MVAGRGAILRQETSGVRPASSRLRAPALTNMPSPRRLLDQFLVDQLLIALKNRERIDPIFRRDIAHGGQRIAFLEHAVEDHRDDAVAKLAVNRLIVVPLTIHRVVKSSFAPPGLCCRGHATHGLRRGLHSCAASRLRQFVRCRSKCAWIGWSFIMNVQSSV